MTAGGGNTVPNAIQMLAVRTTEMSHVTDVVLFCSLLDKENGTIEQINQWLQEKENINLNELDCHAGGNKCMQASVWGGAFNYFNIQEFTDYLLTLPWEFPDNVQVMIQDEHDEQFTLWQMNHLVKNGVPHTFWTQYPDW